MSQDPINKVAADIRKAWRDGKPIEPVRDRLPEGDMRTAYRVQQTNTNHWVNEGRRIVGRKIGLTSKAVQAQIGVDQPDFGILFADMCLADGEEIAPGSVLQPRCEAEVALVLHSALNGEQLTLIDLIGAVAYALPAIEVVGSRIADWRIEIVDTVADNASSGMYVLGTRPVKLSDIDLRECGMVMERKGERISVGSGAACLGNPLNAALWLARKMVEVGMPLNVGDTILTGALGPMVPTVAGDLIEARIEGLGSVRAAFAA